MENDFQREYSIKMAKVESIIGQIRTAKSLKEVNGFVAVIARDPSMSYFLGRVYEKQAEWKKAHKLEEPKFEKTKKR